MGCKETNSIRLPKIALAIGLTGLASACSSGTNEPAASNPLVEEALPDSLEIMTKVYAPAVSTPAGFYRDERDDPAQSFTIHHVKNTDVGLVAPAPFELCADDITVALDWSERDALLRPTSGELVTTDENDMYYEFVRPLTGLPDWVSYGRVFKCSFVDRNGADAGATSGPAGRLAVPSFTSADLKRVSEYFFTFSPFNNPGNAVLGSSAFSNAQSNGYTLTLATLQRNASAQAGCDVVEVRDWEFTARVSDGQMEWTLRPVMSFDSRSRDGLYEVCSP